MYEFNSRMEWTEERISELESRIIEYEQKRENRLYKNEQKHVVCSLLGALCIILLLPL